MAFKQPRVPEYRESEGVSRYIKPLILFLKDFTMSAWTANNMRKREIETLREEMGNIDIPELPDIAYPVTSVNQKKGDVVLSAADVGARDDTWLPTAQEIGALGKDDAVANSEKLGGKDPKYYIQPRNLLDNSDFTNPVNQRGATSYESTSAAIYGIDRWKLNAKGIKAELIPAEGIRLTNTRTDARVPFAQYFEETYIGRTLTAALCDADTGIVYCASGTVPSPTTSTQMFSVVDFNNHTLRLEMNSSGRLTWTLMIAQGKTLKLRWAALYEGAYTADNLPPYMPKGYGAELKECLRYYQAFNNYTTFVGSTKNTAGYWFPYIHTKETMRATPSLSGLPTAASFYGGGLVREVPSITEAVVLSYESGLLRLSLKVAGMQVRTVYDGEIKDFAVSADL